MNAFALIQRCQIDVRLGEFMLTRERGESNFVPRYPRRLGPCTQTVLGNAVEQKRPL